MPRHAAFRNAWLNQLGHLFAWTPVVMACGIGTFFLLRFEPDALLWLVGVAAVLGLGLFVWLKTAARYLCVAICLFCTGFSLAAWRTQALEGPVMGFRYYGPVEGRIIGIDRSASDAVRLTLDRVVLSNISPFETPKRVRVSLHGDQSHFAPLAGDVIMMAAHLSPPSGPVEPGGFDFQRHAWFLQLGGVGYTRSPVLVLTPSAGDKPVLRWRQSVGARVVEVLGQRLGGFATALITGDKSQISRGDLDILRDTNLAHLLAISGMHMGMLAGVVFGAIRGGFALVPSLAMRLPIKKIAAFGALVAATLYLIMSGGAVATERAFVMVCVALLAVMLDQRAISLRAVAVAALVVLGLSPEALLSPGFQMSFAATTALVAVFAGLRDAKFSLGPKWVKPVAALVISSAVAGAATAPIGAAHFNQMSQWGLLANLLSVPVMGAIVMPGIVLAAVLAPFGGEWIGLKIAGMGLLWILEVAQTVADLPQAVRHIPAPSSGVLPAIALGGLMVALWQGRFRFLGVVLIAGGVLAWANVERPMLLIADNGGLVGVMTPEGRAVSRARASSFVAGVWLENDGDSALQEEAFQRWTDHGALRVHHVTGKKASAGFSECDEGDILVANADANRDLPCDVFSPRRLRQTGSIAVDQAGRMTTARQVHGARIWTPWGRD